MKNKFKNVIVGACVGLALCGGALLSGCSLEVAGNPNVTMEQTDLDKLLNNTQEYLTKQNEYAEKLDEIMAKLANTSDSYSDEAIKNKFDILSVSASLYALQHSNYKMTGTQVTYTDENLQGHCDYIGEQMYYLTDSGVKYRSIVTTDDGVEDDYVEVYYTNLEDEDTHEEYNLIHYNLIDETYDRSVQSADSLGSYHFFQGGTEKYFGPTWPQWVNMLEGLKMQVYAEDSSYSISMSVISEDVYEFYISNCDIDDGLFFNIIRFDHNRLVYNMYANLSLSGARPTYYYDFEIQYDIDDFTVDVSACTTDANA